MTRNGSTPRAPKVSKKKERASRHEKSKRARVLVFEWAKSYADSAQTSAVFSAPGTYVLTFTGHLVQPDVTLSDLMVVKINPAANPCHIVVSAGRDFALMVSDTPNGCVNLTGEVSVNGQE